MRYCDSYLDLHDWGHFQSNLSFILRLFLVLFVLLALLFRSQFSRDHSPFCLLLWRACPLVLLVVECPCNGSFGSHDFDNHCNGTNSGRISLVPPCFEYI